MSIDPKTLPDLTVVETDPVPGSGAYPGYLTKARDVWTRGDLVITRVFVPVPDGMTLDDATRALNDTRPWVEWDQEPPYGARMREEWTANRRARRMFIHPDDVPTDPDADLIEAIEDAVGEGAWSGATALAALRDMGFDLVKQEAKP